MAEEGRLRVLCEAAAVDPDLPLRVTLDGLVLAVFAVDDRFYVTQDHCTHGPGSLSEGFVQGDEIECPFHGGRFDLASGRPTAPPCTEPLRTWPVHLVDGKICIDPAEGTVAGGG
jgi:nitrite reductase/ring-hydroxylating ferredoxin subunit